MQGVSEEFSFLLYNSGSTLLAFASLLRVNCDHENTFSSEVVIRGLVGQTLFVLCSILLCIRENQIGRFSEVYFLFLYSDPYQNPHQVPEVNSLWPIRLM